MENNGGISTSVPWEEWWCDEEEKGGVLVDGGGEQLQWERSGRGESQNKEGHLDSIFNGSFDYNQDKPIEDYFYWNEEPFIPGFGKNRVDTTEEDLMTIPDMIKTKSASFS